MKRVAALRAVSVLSAALALISAGLLITGGGADNALNVVTCSLCTATFWLLARTERNLQETEQILVQIEGRR